jgi:hypothetical protein
VKLNDAKRLFFQLRQQNRIDVAEDHVIGDHPERGYTIDEVIGLVKTTGHMEDTTDLQWKGERFYWRTKDVLQKQVRLVIEFEEDEDGELIFVVSAGERT